VEGATDRWPARRAIAGAWRGVDPANQSEHNDNAADRENGKSRNQPNTLTRHHKDALRREEFADLANEITAQTAPRAATDAPPGLKFFNATGRHGELKPSGSFH